MKNLTKYLIAAASAIATLSTIPTVHSFIVSAIAGHPVLTAAVTLVTAIGALVHDPKAS